MEDSVIEFDRLQVDFGPYLNIGVLSGKETVHTSTLYVGQCLSVDVKVPLRVSLQGKNKNIKQLLLRELKSSLRAFISVQGVAGKPRTRSASSVDDNAVSDVKQCDIQASQQEGFSPNSANTSSDPYITEDGLYYVNPLHTQLSGLSGKFSRAEIKVTVSKMEKTNPSSSGKNTRREHSIQRDVRWLHSTLKSTVVVDNSSQKIVKHLVTLIHPPLIYFQQKSSHGKHFIIMQVSNTTNKDLELKDCVLLPESCPRKPVDKSTCKACQQINIDTNSASHCNMVRLLHTDQQILPTKLSARENLSLIYTIHPSNNSQGLVKETVNLVAHLKWNVVKSDNTAAVLTTYSLPAVKLRQIPFVMSAACKDDKTVAGGSVHVLVSYSITNKLQDFLGVRLYWSPSLPVDCSNEERKELQQMEESLICHDPSIDLGACAYGSSVQIQVGFQILKPGVYEVGKHMKMNLRYAVPSPDKSPTPASDNLSLLSGEDPLGILGDLFSRRSGSSSNLSQCQCSDDKRSSSRSPSSFLRQPRTNYSQKQMEQMLINPANFLKNSCQIYIPKMQYDSVQQNLPA